MSPIVIFIIGVTLRATGVQDQVFQGVGGASPEACVTTPTHTVPGKVQSLLVSFPAND